MVPVITELRVAPHPSLALGAFTTELPRPLSDMQSPAELLALLRLDAAAPLERDETVRAAVRDMLRHGGYKPTGRGKPASEYLVRAAGEGKLGPINLAVDACNAVSLHSGLPISVVDAERVEPPLEAAIVDGDQRYVFNASGQELRVAGLLCLHDAAGPCANGVKDSQRSKTHDGTRHTVSVVWGVAGHEERLERALAWYRELLEAAGASTGDVALVS
jgi:DNA/RNA-binding domain of Phe-tRNA-synthetase-like protein